MDEIIFSLMIACPILGIFFGILGHFIVKNADSKFGYIVGGICFFIAGCFALTLIITIAVNMNAEFNYTR